MRNFYFIFLIFGIASAGLAQEAPAPDATPHLLPKGPLLKLRAPETAQWTITYNPIKPSEKDKEKPPFTEFVTVTKTKKVTMQQSTDSKGLKKETWVIGDTQYATMPGSTKFMAFDPRTMMRGGTEGLCVDFSATDFPGFQWISAKNYVDVVKYMDRDCILFRDKVDLMTDEEVKALKHEYAREVKDGGTPIKVENASFATTAYVDLETRLPVMLQRGETTSIYQFLTPKQTTLTLPPEVQSDLDRRAARSKELVRMPPRPN